MNHSCLVAYPTKKCAGREPSQVWNNKCELCDYYFLDFSNICCFVLLPSAPIRDASGSIDIFYLLMKLKSFFFFCIDSVHLPHIRLPFCSPSFSYSSTTSCAVSSVGSILLLFLNTHLSLPSPWGFHRCRGAHPLWERHYWQTCALVIRIYCACMDMRGALKSTTSFGSFAGWKNLHTKGIR